MVVLILYGYFFFFNDTATTEIYTLSLHDALPISVGPDREERRVAEVEKARVTDHDVEAEGEEHVDRSEEHTSELQSRLHLVCRLLLEKKKDKTPSVEWLFPWLALISFTTANTTAF